MLLPFEELLSIEEDAKLSTVKAVSVHCMLDIGCPISTTLELKFFTSVVRSMHRCKTSLFVEGKAPLFVAGKKIYVYVHVCIYIYIHMYTHI